MTKSDCLSVREAARRIGVGASLVYQSCAEGVLPHYRLGASGRRGKILIEPAELDRLWEARRIEGGRNSTEPLRHIVTGRKV